MITDKHYCVPKNQTERTFQAICDINLICLAQNVFKLKNIYRPSTYAYRAVRCPPRF